MSAVISPSSSESSRRFSAEILPDAYLRRRVQVVAAAAMLYGAGLILHMSLPILARILLLPGWIFLVAWELVRQGRGAFRVARIRIFADGEMTVCDHQGRNCRVRLLAGTLVLPGFAWLRLEFPDGSKYGELVAPKSADDQQWHRFMLIWQQIGPVFGRTGGT